MSLKEMAEDLQKRREKAMQMGGAEKVAKQHSRGKLTCRERIGLLFDKGTFVEIGIHATHQSTSPQMAGKETPADGIVTGTGKVDGRWLAAGAYDFTVLGGSIGQVNERKMERLREISLRERIPMVWLIDSAGARIHETSGFAAGFAATGKLFFDQIIMSGVVPQVCAMVGPGAAGTAYIPGLADFVPMVKGTSNMALAGPPLVKAVTGEDINEEDLGGSKVHTELSGVADLQVENDEECIRLIREYLSYFPSNCGEKPPIIECTDPIDRQDDELLSIVPDNPRKPYNMYKVIERIVDHGKYFDLKPKWGRTMITCLARIGGRSVGIVANQPNFMAGIIDVNSADKAARFVSLCDAFNVPLVFLMDVPGFMVGSKVEREGIIRHGAKMLHMVAAATVPKCSVVVRKAYGAGYYVMAGAAYEPDLMVAWPTAEISVMGPEGMVNILARRELADADEATKQAMVEQIRGMINPYLSAGAAMIDDVIDPRETRERIALALEFSEKKEVYRPRKKRGVIPV
jgi:acetyl-CoA carboxylase carboxyltransferase component